jgi:hypothetical protein
MNKINKIFKNRFLEKSLKIRYERKIGILSKNKLAYYHSLDEVMYIYNNIGKGSGIYYYVFDIYGEILYSVTLYKNIPPYYKQSSLYA